jgi:hypothetical protein
MSNKNIGVEGQDNLKKILKKLRDAVLKQHPFFFSLFFCSKISCS